MLTSHDYNHLILLYDNFFKANSLVKDLILADDWDGVEDAVEKKDDLIRQIIFFEKPRVESIKDNKELMNKRQKLVQLEKNNIELVKIKKQELIQEITSVSKARKVLNAYEPSINNISSTFEVNFEE